MELVMKVFLVIVCCVCAAVVTADPNMPRFNLYHSSPLFSGHIKRQKAIQALEVSTGDMGKVSPLCCFLVSFLPLARAFFVKATMQTESLEDCLFFESDFY